MTNTEAVARYRQRHPERVLASRAQSYARQLLRGEPILNATNHHLGMALLKAPRPDGMELSLVNYHSPDAYWGRRGHKGHKPYRLSVNPDDYIWETRAENHARQERYQ